MKDTATHVVIIRDERLRARALDVLNALTLGDKPWQMTIEPYQSKRSLAQNSLLHVWMRHLSKQYAETYGEHHAPGVWKLYFKRLFLGEEHVEVRGMQLDETRHTSDLDVMEFAAFLNSIDHYCGAELLISLPRPTYLWREAMG